MSPFWENPPASNAKPHDDDEKPPVLVEWTPSPATAPLPAPGDAKMPPAPLKPADAVTTQPDVAEGDAAAPTAPTGDEAKAAADASAPATPSPADTPAGTPEDAATTPPAEGDAAPTTPEAPATAEQTAPAAAPTVPTEVPVTAESPEEDLKRPVAVCPQCGGSVDSDGYCTQCGAKAPLPRDHMEEDPATWVAGVSDRGVRHSRNEDAMALWADDAGRAVLVICDGVSMSEDSDTAALAAARAIRDRLSQAGTFASDASRGAARLAAVIDAAALGNEAVISHTRPESENSAACTLALVVIDGTSALVGNLGDSRVYWIAGDGGQILSLDDSVAQDLIQQGTARKAAEEAKDAHAITRWLGKDATDVVPRTADFAVPGDGWLVVCSDGLWNYASSAEEMATQVKAASEASAAPLDVGRALVAWATAQGGKDNISVALARFGANLPVESASEGVA